MIGDLLWRLSRPAAHGEVLVRRALAYISAARNGLSENEILDVLSADDEVMRDFRRRSPRSPEVKSLPPVVWSRLHGDLEPYLAMRGADNTSLLGFYHRQFAEAVSGKFLTEESGPETHAALARYFGDQALWIGEAPGRAPNCRKCSELPYQQTQSGCMWMKLVATLTELDFVDAKSKAGMVYDLVADYNRAQAALPGGSRRSPERGRAPGAHQGLRGPPHRTCSEPGCQPAAGAAAFGGDQKRAACIGSQGRLDPA